MYYLKIKDDIAIAVSLSEPEISFDCDRTDEVADEVAYTINLPCKKINDEWVHCDDFPHIDYPEPVDPEPALPQTTLEEQAEINASQDEIIAALYEENLSLTEQLAEQTDINAAQDESLIDIYELMFAE